MPAPPPMTATWTLLVGPGARLAPLKAVLEALRGAGHAADLRALGDLDGLLRPLAEHGRLLLDVDDLDPEDLGFVRRFFERNPTWSVVLVGDDPRARLARRLLAEPRCEWLFWPVDVEQLAGFLRAPGGAPARGRGPSNGVRPRALPSRSEPAAEPARDPEVEEVRRILLGGAPRAHEEPRHAPPHRDAPAGGRSLAEPAAEADAFDEEPGGSLEREDEQGPLEAARERAEAALEERDDPLGAYGDDPRGAYGNDPRGAYGAGGAPSTSSPEGAGAEPPTLPPYYRNQIADLADIAQRVQLATAALREGGALPPAAAEAAGRVEASVQRLVQFTRTLGYLAAPPARGEQRLDLSVLLEEMLAMVAAGGKEAPRFLFRSGGTLPMRSDKQLLVQALDALLQVARACAGAGEIVRASTRSGGPPRGGAVVEITFPAGPLAGVAAEEILRPYSLRERLGESIGPNAVAAARGILRGQGGELRVGAPAPGRLRWELWLPSESG